MTSDTKPNEAEISIYNLKPEHKAFVRQRNLKVELSAGYGENIGLIFRGSIEFAPSQQDDLDWVTTLIARDGAINYRSINVSKSFKKGAPLDQVIRALINALKLPAPMVNGLHTINELSEGTIRYNKLNLKYDRYWQEMNRPSHSATRTAKVMSREEFMAKEREQDAANAKNAAEVKLMKGEVLMGAAHKQLDLICRSYGLDWNITNQTINVFPKGGIITAETILISAGSGMVGSPEPQEDGSIKVRTLLRHEIEPAYAIAIAGKEAEGDFRVKTVEHELDTMSAGEHWITGLECTPLR